MGSIANAEAAARESHFPHGPQSLACDGCSPGVSHTTNNVDNAERAPLPTIINDICHIQHTEATGNSVKDAFGVESYQYLRELLSFTEGRAAAK